ncbi:MAG: transcription-repair coupling factor [Candidatus Omnitrophica bacterium]|nr:transcription-repair coupling factor [Candidatus Omnitrophota bacterium]
MSFIESRSFLSLKKQLESSSKSVSIVGSDSPVSIAKLISDQRWRDFESFPHIVIFSNETEAQDFIDNLTFFGSEKETHFLPAFDMSPYSGLYPNTRYISQRLKWLSEIRSTPKGKIFVATAESILQKTLPVKDFENHSLSFVAGDEWPEKVGRLLSNMGYAGAPQVEDVGQYSVRGGIVDVFSPAEDLPIRIELFGDQIESLRAFDPATQRSLHTVKSIKIIPSREIVFDDDSQSRALQNLRMNFKGRKLPHHEIDGILQDIKLGRYFHGIDYLLNDFYEKTASVLEFAREDFCLWWVNPIECERQAELFQKELSDQRLHSHTHAVLPHVGELYFGWSERPGTHAFKTIDVNNVAITNTLEEDGSIVDLPCTKIKASEIQANESLASVLNERLKGWWGANQRVVLATHTISQAQRIKSLLDSNNILSSIVDVETKGWSWSVDGIWNEEARNVAIVPVPLSDSVRLPDDELILIREEDFFGTKKRSTKKPQASQDTMSIDFAELNPGSRVVHIQHGVAVFDGLMTMQVNGVESEFLQLRFRDDDKLYLPIYRVGQIQKFSGAGPLDKLGTNNWEKTKVKVRAHLRDIANDLLELYAKRKQTKRTPFEEPTNDFREFEAYFPYDETADQIKAIGDVLSDFEDDSPMDRLICGDVGFGKTEVAMRAAFRVVQEGKQVAVLVPTTILALQHLENFRKRFSKWPVEVKGYSRFTSTKDSKEVVEGLKSGKVDIVIGTHRLLGRDLSFKKLGLLIIDEEQRFGVKHKERLKHFRILADVLTLTATPIPRTLHMALTGAKDMSVIATAPTNRIPVKTEVVEFDEEVIQRALARELRRKGQSFFLHNRVEDIEQIARIIGRLVPKARIAVGHGQMSPKELEHIMLQFLEGEIDILVCTTIIGSGIDIPNANTLIVNRADHFGLSDLHQLRGRVGRSQVKAYAYFVIPSWKTLSTDAKARIDAIEKYSHLGSGFQIAFEDLQIRGAGNLLGQEQSGYIASIGFDLYCRLLKESVEHLKTSGGAGNE